MKDELEGCDVSTPACSGDGPMKFNKFSRDILGDVRRCEVGSYKSNSQWEDWINTICG